MSPRDDKGKVKVKVTESVPLAVGNWLLAHREEFNIWPGDKEGYAAHDETATYVLFDEDDASSPLGLLYKAEHHQQKSRLWGRWKYTVTDYTRDYIGILSQADTDEWSMKVYGREHLERCQELAHRLSTAFKVKVSVKLVREKPYDMKFLPGEFY